MSRFFFVLFFFLCASVGAGELILKSQPSISIPSIEQNRAVYRVKFSFNKNPTDYIVYYDRFQKNLVIDFYSFTLSWPDSNKLKGTFSGEINVRNVETAMSLKGLKGQILFNLEKGWEFEKGWHYEAYVNSPSTLELKLWKELRPAVSTKKKK